VNAYRQVVRALDVAVHERDVLFFDGISGVVVRDAAENMRLEGSEGRGKRRGGEVNGSSLMKRPDHPCGDVHLCVSPWNDSVAT
jgi:hypothetical protein